MGNVPQEHEKLYFDKLARTQKRDTVKSLIIASYRCRDLTKPEEKKKKMAELLEPIFDLNRENPRGASSGSGSYSGTTSQFNSQYTLGRELDIWKDSSCNLTNFAEKVAKDEITIIEYFDRFFLNYFQPVGGENIHLLYRILQHLIQNHMREIHKDDLAKALKVEFADGALNALVQFLEDTSYFDFVDGKLILSDKYDPELLIKMCNTIYDGKEGYVKASNDFDLELDNSPIYDSYIETTKSEIDSCFETLLSFSKPYYDMCHDDKTLFDNVNKLKSNPVILDKLLNSYQEQDFVFTSKKSGYKKTKAASVVRYIILKALKKGEEINTSFIDKIKEYILNKKENELSKYFDDKQILKEVCELIKNRSFESWDTSYSICFAFFYGENEKKLVKKCEDVMKKHIFDDLDLEDEDMHLWDILGASNYGNDRLSFAIYPSVLEHAYCSFQLAIEFVNDQCNVFLYKGDRCTDERDIHSDTKISCATYADVISAIKTLFDEYNLLNANLVNDASSTTDENDDSNVIDNKINDNLSSNLSLMQVIFYGAPGTGKSKTIDDIISKVYKNSDEQKKHVARVIFHPDYTYSDFVGTIMPVRRENLDYEFVGGPFLELLAKAFKDQDKPYFLVLEEINRGNAAAIFGDVFQLLDRKKNGESLYRIYNHDMADWMYKKTNIDEFLDDYIWLPNNFNILCTMNTADQNVFVLDSAFKRRFSMEHIKIDFDNLPESMNSINDIFVTEVSLLDLFKDSKISEYIISLNNDNQLNRDWKTFARIVNHIIDTVNIEGGSDQISEDKKLGPFFVNEEELKDKTRFINKVLYYLKEDVFKYVDYYFAESFESLYDRYTKDDSDLFEMLSVK